MDLKGKLTKIQRGNIEYYGYNERGVISLMMFRGLDTVENMVRFLGMIRLRDGKRLLEIYGSEVRWARIFSELEFGKAGFGCPDGMVSITFEPGKEWLPRGKNVPDLDLRHEGSIKVGRGLT